MHRGLYEDAEEVGRTIKTTVDVAMARGLIIPSGSRGRVIRVEPAGNSIVYVAKMTDGSTRAFVRKDFRFVKQSRHPQLNGDVTGYDPEADEPAYAAEEVREADLYSNRGRGKPRRKNIGPYRPGSTRLRAHIDWANWGRPADAEAERSIKRDILEAIKTMLHKRLTEQPFFQDADDGVDFYFAISGAHGSAIEELSHVFERGEIEFDVVDMGPKSANSDEEIRRLEREALAGDVDAIRRLVARASHAPPLPQHGIVLQPRPYGSRVRNVRNFWITLDVDGKATVGTGPSGATGGFSLTILMRDQGGAVEAMTVRGRATQDGRLVLDVNGQPTLTTER